MWESMAELALGMLQPVTVDMWPTSVPHPRAGLQLPQHMIVLLSPQTAWTGLLAGLTLELSTRGQGLELRLSASPEPAVGGAADWHAPPACILSMQRSNSQR